MRYKRFFFLAIFIVALIYWFKTKPSKISIVLKDDLQTTSNIESSKSPAKNEPINLNLNSENTVLSNTSQQDAIKIKEQIKIFENFKYQKDFSNAIGVMTPPQNVEEKGWLGHLLGTDLADLNNGKPSPRFLGKAYFHILVGFGIENINKKDNTYYANVNELRVINSAEGTPKYITQTQNLTFEIIIDESEYKISKYYHTNPTSSTNLKYDGFVAF